MHEVDAQATNPVHRFRAAAVGHLNAAHVVHEYLQHGNIAREDSTWVALQNLIGLAAESAFKGYLLSHDSSANVRRHNIGHNLVALYQMCVDAGLPREHVDENLGELSDALRRVAEQLKTDHGSYNYRYIEGDELAILGAQV